MNNIKLEKVVDNMENAEEKKKHKNLIYIDFNFLQCMKP